MKYDVVIVGGGPAGLSAALALGRGRKRVLLCDAGARRNAAAVHLHNFVTRDGTPPDEFRRIGREQLVPYPNVEVRDARVQSVAGVKGDFHLVVEGAQLQARRILVCTGMVDEMLPVEGFRELWGHAVFQCPYCHGWEVKERAWGYLAREAAGVPFAILLRGWSQEVTLFTQGAFTLEPAQRTTLEAAGVRIETRPVTRLRRREHQLDGLELSDGVVIPCEALFAHPPQRHVDLVSTLGVELDGDGLVKVDPMSRETTVPGIYGAGDLTTRAQGAMFAAAAGVQAAAMINHELTGELASKGLV